MRECDLIMKGGITSGVVYPFAIQELAKAYRLKSIGGSSAGAIAASIAAAAEYRRQTATDGSADEGYRLLGVLAGELATRMGGLFQPAPALDKLFEVLMAYVATGGGAGPMVRAVFRVYRGRLGLAAVLALVAVLAAIWAGSLWLGLLGIVLALIVAVISVGWALYRNLCCDLPAHDYGICPGTTQGDQPQPGLTDWIADWIDTVAGNLGPDGRPGDPLTIGALEAAGVELAAMTTDLSSQRPYQLPLRSEHHFFSRREFERLFPARVVAYLCRGKAPWPSGVEGGPDDLYPLPQGPDFPVLLCARMSLSFPGLIAAVPLWRKDFGLCDASGEKGLYCRCLFSDGGISSNFPVLFFDALLPRRPTFGITLTDWELARHGEERVHLSDRPVQSTDMPVRRTSGVLSFLMSIVNSAKDWQDTLQSKLPGYAERIVEIRLDPAREGGMNLDMDAATIETLAGHGREAGKRLVAGFSFDENRWRRALSVLPALEQSLEGLNRAYRHRPEGESGPGRSYAEILTDYAPGMYPNSAAWRKEVLDALAGRLAAIGAAITAAGDTPGKHRVRDGNLPSQDARLRLLADADRRPAPQA